MTKTDNVQPGGGPRVLSHDVPDGHVVVPTVPTNSMLVAGSIAARRECMDHDPDLAAIYCAMVAAAGDAP